LIKLAFHFSHLQGFRRPNIVLRYNCNTLLGILIFVFRKKLREEEEEEEEIIK
jgi:hypothetical protein